MIVKQQKLMTEKRTDVGIYILGHKPLSYGYWDNSLYTPLQVGACFNPPFLEHRDNTGNNIGDWNGVFAEGTGIYWAAFNCPDSFNYVGTCQYRRRLEFPENFDFDAVFKRYGVIVSEPLILPFSLKKQYEKCHSRTELDIVRDAVHTLYPELDGAWKKYVEDGNLLFYSTSMIMQREHYAEYADFYSNVAFMALNDIMGLWTPKDVMEYTAKEIKEGRKPNNDGKFGEKDPVRYQMQLAGFWQERLASLWIRDKFGDSIAIAPFTKFEGV